MILAHFGAWIPLEQLRSATGVSRDGAKASNILKGARKFGLVAKGFKKEVDTLAELEWPLVVHWNFNHYVVLEGFKGGRAWLNDPAWGPRSVSMEEFDEGFTGVALAFEPGPAFTKTAKPPGLLVALADRLRGSRQALAFISLLGIALVLPGIVIPAFAQVFVDGIVQNHQDRWLVPLVLAMAVTATMRGLLTLAQQRVLVRLETKLAVVGASSFVWHVIRMPMSFFTQRHAGEISNRVSANDRVAKLLSGQYSDTLLQMGTAMFFSIVMLTYDLPLAAVTIALAIPNYFVLRAMRDRMRQTSRRVLAAKGKVSAATIGAIHNIETLKGSGIEMEAFERWTGYHAKALSAMRELGAQSVPISVVPTTLSNLTNVTVLGLGAWRVMSGAITIGDLVAFQTLAASFAAPIAAFVALSTTTAAIRADLQRIGDALKNPVDPLVAAEQESNPNLSLLRGGVELVDVAFGYSALEPPLMEGINLKLNPGMRVALVGSSGSGKSTVGRLICGLLEPWAGEVLLDGQPINSISQASRARSLAYVDQDIFLFAGTVSENLTLWNRSVPDEDVTRALSDACMLDEVAVRPGQIDAWVEEGGRNFSGGQRQRLEIARALVGNPAILVLDEATAALDTTTEKLIDENLRRRGCTCVIIAHRLSTIRDCDEIIVLRYGKAIERGTHEDLMALGGQYATLIRST